MDYTKESEDAEDTEGGKDNPFFIEGYSSSDGEGELEFSHQKHLSTCKQASRLSGESSPPLLLAFTSRRALQDSSLDCQEEQEEDSDQSIEEWMILDEEQEWDSSIQLNLSYWNNSEDDSGDEGWTIHDLTLG